MQVDHLTQHMEASERSMQDRVQRLEAIRIALEEVRGGACRWERRSMPQVLRGIFQC